MLLKRFLIIFQNDKVKAVLITLGEIAMVMMVFWALLSQNPQEIEFIYANF